MTARIIEKAPLDTQSVRPWPTLDPFLFCVHHRDLYPRGNERLGPAASLVGRPLGNDFAGIDGWRMYHGEEVPGFPQHPHRGFETVTIARQGFIDHSDSLGAAARFGSGDVQWLTAGRGIVHSEMFPLLEEEEPNTVELFQIWLNLPSQDKLVEPHFRMLWSDMIPHVVQQNGGARSEALLIAGQLGEVRAPTPPPHSWAAREEADVGIVTARLDPGGRLSLPPAATPQTMRVIYFFSGKRLGVGEDWIEGAQICAIEPMKELVLKAGDSTSDDTGAEVLMLQGRPIGEPVAHHGPFVMNTQAELRQAFVDYQRDQFGGWPWPKDDPVHPRDRGRFARHADGHVEERASSDSSSA